MEKNAAILLVPNPEDTRKLLADGAPVYVMSGIWKGEVGWAFVDKIRPGWSHVLFYADENWRPSHLASYHLALRLVWDHQVIQEGYIRALSCVHEGEPWRDIRVGKLWPTVEDCQSLADFCARTFGGRVEVLP